MGTPFATAVAPTSTDAATDGQLSYIARLLRTQDWQSGPAKHVERAAALNMVIGWALDGCDLDPVVELMTADTDGERINQVLARMITQAEQGREYVWVPLTKSGASKMIDWLNTRGERATAAPEPAAERPWGRTPDAETVPAGRYAIDTQVHAVNGTAFYKVDRPTQGRWAGRVFVKQLIGGNEQRLSQKQGLGIVARIAEAGAREASIRYGKEIGECGRCGITLTNDESRAYGIGPECRKKAGW